jgi:tRNA(His) 5'-end guanylyltransferase
MDKEKDADMLKLARKCYDCIVRSNINDIFIIYEERDEIVEIVYDLEMRKKAIDKLIKYFENVEEYERCAVLLKILKNN